MRRALATLLIAVFGFPLIAASIFAQAASDLPACCRRAGKHHCSMPGQRDSTGGPSVTATQAKCPLFPSTQTVPSYTRTILLAAAPRVGAPHLAGLTMAAVDGGYPCITLRNTIQKRGPPVLS
jgi:hypothetical protein